MEDPKFLDFSKVCRLCLLENSDMRTLLDPSTLELVTVCGGIEIHENDGLPNIVCVGCLEKAQGFFAFRQQCKRSDTLLRDMSKQYCPQTYLLYLTNEENCESGPPLLSLSEVSNDLELEAVDAINQALQAELERRSTTEKNSNEIIEFLNDKSIPEINEALAKEYFQIINTQAEQPDETPSLVEAFESEWVCEMCQTQKQFRTRRSFRKHMKRHEEEALENSTILQKYECEICKKRFKERSKLNTHKKIHEAKNEKCSFCDKSFTHAWQLKTHLKVHQGLREFICNYCCLSFGQKVNLDNHVRSKHTFDKPFKCTMEGCPKAFPSKGELSKHFRKHTGEKPAWKVFCPICSKGCTDNAQLRLHTRTHTKEYKHECQVPNCGKKFLLRSHLTVHMRSHTQERPFACLVCTKAFYTNELLSKHTKKVHAKQQPVES